MVKDEAQLGIDGNNPPLPLNCRFVYYKFIEAASCFSVEARNLKA